MVAKSYIPKRGDFIMVNFNPQVGKEQSGHRPALVISDSRYNKLTGLCIACPVTNSIKGFPFEVVCNSPVISGVILADHSRNIDWKDREAVFKAKASQKVLNEVTGKLKALIKA